MAIFHSQLLVSQRAISSHAKAHPTPLRLPVAEPAADVVPLGLVWHLVKGGVHSNKKSRKVFHGSLNVPIFHITQPLDSIRYMVYNGYCKVMSKIPKMGHLTTPVFGKTQTAGIRWFFFLGYAVRQLWISMDFNGIAMLIQERWKLHPRFC